MQKARESSSFDRQFGCSHDPFLRACFIGVRMFDFLGDLVSWVFDFIKEYLLIILIVVLIVICIWFPALLPVIWAWVVETAIPWIAAAFAEVGAFFAGLGVEGAIAAALGIGLLIDPEGTSEAVSNVLAGAGKGVGNALSALGINLSNPLVWAAAAAAVYFVVRNDDTDESSSDTVVITQDPNAVSNQIVEPDQNISDSNSIT